jgi:glyoxylase-like metal-dependent hydrolase (beta-lactamase superfamily II)
MLDERLTTGMGYRMRHVNAYASTAARAALTLALLATCPATRADVPAVAAQAAQVVTPEVWMIPGGVQTDRQPDGNSVIFRAPDGLVVVDTGRHSSHRQAVLALAKSQDRPIVAVVNTHWHLDHVSGNPDLRAAYPGLRVYATDAIDDALGGFLARSARDAVGYLDDPQIPQTMRDDIRADLLTIQNGAALRPDVVLESSGEVSLGGRILEIHLAADAVTAGDLWLYDPAQRLAVLGDLVTLPAPYLDTACPQGWAAALGKVAAVPFEVAIPGHGPVMGRAQFDIYRGAFTSFIGCVSSARPAGECAIGWADGVEALLADGPPARQRAVDAATYYVEMLRTHGGRSRDCAASPAVR